MLRPYENITGRVGFRCRIGPVGMSDSAGTPVNSGRTAAGAADTSWSHRRIGLFSVRVCEVRTAVG